MNEPVPLAPEAPDAEQRQWAMAAHLCGLLWLFGGGSILFWPFGTLALFTVLGPLIIWKAKGEGRPFVTEQAKEALNFQLTMLLAGLAGWILVIVLVGILVIWVLGLLNLILVIIAAIQVNDGKPYRYPFALRLVQ